MDNLVRTLLYLGTLLAAIALLREPRAARAVEPVLALGAFVAIGYGLLGRLLPGLIDHLASIKGGGRLEQPITYWNAEGLLAAMGLVLCVRLAGDGSRPVALRAGAGAAGSLLGLGLYLTYSRGAIAAVVVGLVVLLAAVPTGPTCARSASCSAAPRSWSWARCSCRRWARPRERSPSASGTA